MPGGSLACRASATARARLTFMSDSVVAPAYGWERKAGAGEAPWVAGSIMPFWQVKHVAALQPCWH